MLYDGTFIKLDEDGRVWLKLYGDFSDPDEPTPSDIQVSDVELLGYADDYPGIMRTLVRKRICLWMRRESNSTRRLMPTGRMLPNTICQHFCFDELFPHSEESPCRPRRF